jgi:hypothetical protein
MALGKGRVWWVAVTALWMASAASAAQQHGGSSDARGLRSMVEADWAAQEARRGREVHAPKAITDALRSARRLIERLEDVPVDLDLAADRRALADLGREAQRLDSLDNPARRALYLRIRALGRRVALRNPLLAGRPLLFMKRRRFTTQMLHEYLGYFYDYGDIDGGGLFVLKQPGSSLELRDLTARAFPRGNFTTLALSFDAKTVYFAYAERAGEKPDFYSARRRCFHIFAMDADGEQLRRLTRGPYDDFDPCPLPDGGIAFVSTRRGGFGRCHNPWEPLPAYTLHRMDADGGNIRTLSFHETNEWHPSVLHDGRIVYTRWDYVDRSAANYHGLWVSNPDGTNPSVLFGNYTRAINACYQAKAIPGSHRIAFLAGAHHAAVGGSLVLVDPHLVQLDPATGHDGLQAIERLTPEVCFPEAPGWPGSYFHSPWPLSEDFYLVSFSFDPLPGMGPKVNRDTETGLYYFDRFGNLELLYREPGISCMYPMLMAPRPEPRAMTGDLDPTLGDEGEFLVSDLTTSHLSLPESRAIVALRVFQVLPKTSTHVANQPRIGYANAESARALLGTIPVEADGSAYFRVPARKPLYFQAVDAEGRAVQSMRSVTYVQPGERRGCVGCHESTGTSSAVERVLALERPPSVIQPGPDGSLPFSFPRLVQPILDRHCVPCHDGTDGVQPSRIVLTREAEGTFSRSYESLRPFVRWHEWGSASIHQVVTIPGRIGADESPLLGVLTDEKHAEDVSLTDEERRRLYLWLDGNAPFYGVYEEHEQRAQRSGAAVPLPAVQ